MLASNQTVVHSTPIRNGTSRKDADKAIQSEDKASERQLTERISERFAVDWPVSGLRKAEAKHARETKSHKYPVHLGNVDLALHNLRMKIDFILGQAGLLGRKQK